MADKDNIEAWITVKGNHIPILKGQSKEEAVKAFLAKKSSESPKNGEKPDGGKVVAKKEENAPKAKKKADAFALSKRREYQGLELPRNADVKEIAEKLVEYGDKVFKGNGFEVFAFGSGQEFEKPDDRHGFTGERAQVHTKGVYALVKKWEKSKEYAQKAYKNLLERMSIDTGASRYWLALDNKSINSLGQRIIDIYEKAVKDDKITGWKTGDMDTMCEQIDKLYEGSGWLSGEYYEKHLLKDIVLRFMNHDDFENAETFKKGVERALVDAKTLKDEYKAIKPQITVGYVPPKTKARLFVTGLQHKGYLKDQTDEIKKSVQRLADSLPKKHEEYYEYAGNKYVIRALSAFWGNRISASLYDEKNNVLSSTTVTRELEEKLTDLIAQDKIKPAGVANIRPLEVSDYTSFDTIMSAVADATGSYEYAEKKLAEYGIYGLKYKGTQDDECIVMYDPAMFSVVARNVGGKWRDSSGNISKNERARLKTTPEYKDFQSGVKTLISDMKHYDIKGLKVLTPEPDAHINGAGGFSSYVEMEYTRKDGEKVNFRMRISDHPKREKDKSGTTQIYHRFENLMNGRTLEQKIKDKIAQIESLKPGESLPIEKNTTSDEKDTE